MGFFDKLLGKKKTEPVQPPDENREAFEASGEIGGAKPSPAMDGLSKTEARDIQTEGATKLENLRGFADKAMDDAKSEFEVAQSLEDEAQEAVADAKLDVTSRIKGVFNRLETKNPISAIAELSNELGAIESDVVAMENGAAKEAAMQAVKDFRVKLKQTYEG